jgi:hypothetical protein
VSLPEYYIQPKDKSIPAISFDLAPGEMIYDLNGFNYQTYMYNDAGVRAVFGEGFGGFEDVKVFDVLLDMYANRVNMEINTEVLLELLDFNWVKAKIYTNKEDNADGRAGEILCSIAPTIITGAFGPGVDMVVDGGFFRKDGLHMNGSMIIGTDEVQTADEPLSFINFIIPAQMEKTNEANNPARKYGNVQLDKPSNVRFQGFTMEVRQFDITCMFADLVGMSGRRFEINKDIPVHLTLLGSTLLSENIPLGQETTDSIVMQRYDYAHQIYEGEQYYDEFMESKKPRVLYDECVSDLNANLDESVEIRGKLVPNLTATGNIAATPVSARGGDTDIQYVFLSSNQPPLPPTPAYPNPDDYFNDAMGTAQEQAKAYQKALESEIARFQDAVEDQIDQMKGMAQDQIEAYKQQAKAALEEYKQNAINSLQGIAQDIKDKLTEELSKYIDLGMLGEGLIEFDADTLTFGMLDALQGVDAKTTIRFGYDMRNKRCYYAVGVAAVDEDSKIDLSIMKVKNFAGLFFHNLEPQTDIKTPGSFPRSFEGLEEYIKKVPVYRGAGSTTGIGLIGDMTLGNAVMIKDMYMYISSGPIISASGNLMAKTNLKDFKLVAAASICYSHPERYFSVSCTVKNIPLLIFDISGSIGYEVGLRPMLFGVYIGYPETLKLGKILGVAELGAGFCFRVAKDDTSFIAMKVEAGMDVDIDLYIIYARGFLKFGADGIYEFRQNASNYFELNLWIHGGIKGGINAFGAKWNIINIYADAVGTLAKGSQTNPNDSRLHAKADIKIGYHLNVLLGTVSGSKEFHFKHDF